MEQKSYPDIVCLGKALTGGYSPLAVTLTTDSVFNSFLGKPTESKQLYHGHTFTGHPIGCAAAIANIRMYEKYELLQKIRQNSAYMSRRLREIKHLPIAENMRSKGLLGGIDLAKTKRPILELGNGVTISSYIAKESLNMGVFLRSLGNTIVIIPPLAIRRRDLKFLLDTIHSLINKIERSL
jgi:adenosylmethionine-8-amino-7-oxononanoate aminotransferase